MLFNQTKNDASIVTGCNKPQPPAERITRTSELTSVYDPKTGHLDYGDRGRANLFVQRVSQRTTVRAADAPHDSPGMTLSGLILSCSKG